jgi:hypothetical protein
MQSYISRALLLFEFECGRCYAFTIDTGGAYVLVDLYRQLVA